MNILLALLVSFNAHALEPADEIFPEEIEQVVIDAPPPVVAPKPKPSKRLPFCKKILLSNIPQNFQICIPKNKGACFCKEKGL